MVKTFDVFSASIEEASVLLAPSLELSSERMAQMQRACTIVDYLIKDFDCKALETDVDLETATGLISIECIDIVLEKRVSHPFFELLKYATGFEIINTDGETMKLTFIFDGIWSPAQEVVD